MPVWPEAAAVTRSLARLARGRAKLAAIDGGTIGVAIGTALVTALWLDGHAPAHLIGWTLATAVTASIVAALALVESRRRSLALDIERRAPACHNLVVTAVELLNDPTRVRPDIGALVCRHAAIRLEPLDTRAVFPVGPATRRGLAAVAVSVAVIATTQVRPLTRSADHRPTARRLAIGHLTITIQAPAYAALPDRTLPDPTTVEALVGSRLHVVVDTEASAVVLETLEGRQSLTPASGIFGGDVLLARDGFLSIQPTDGAEAGPRRMVGLIAVPDRPPVVRITEPGRDLFVPDGRQHVPVALQAEDDLGMASLSLAYTRVTGSGEDFTFGEGEVPIAITRIDDRHWHATVDWHLASLALAPGDMVVYRARAADRRPGATPVESDSFMVQVLTANQADLGGFAVDEDPNKYALSQRMVILKTERLLAKKSTMGSSDFAEEGLTIGAEERQVRAMFIFMLGGEFEDAAVGDTLNEIAEAESEGDIAAGRLHNQARVDLAAATRKMSSASASLAVPDVPAALIDENAALDAIQRAFSKDRYLLRAMSSVERIDLSRRLGGALTELARGPRPAAVPEPPAAAAALRRLLARLVSEASDQSATRARALSAIADDCLRADPSSRALRDIAAALGQAAAEPTASDGTHPMLDRATIALAAIIRASSPEAPGTVSPDLRRLDGALAAAAKPGGGGPPR
jgi:hypothetical protein